jgi:hypothetical protein
MRISPKVHSANIAVVKAAIEAREKVAMLPKRKLKHRKEKQPRVA